MSGWTPCEYLPNRTARYLPRTTFALLGAMLAAAGLPSKSIGSILSAARTHACQLSSTNQALCWGNNLSGQLGVDPAGSYQFTAQGFHPIPEPVTGLPVPIASIETGGDTTCAVASGGVWCWGDNTVGQLGDGTLVMRVQPTAVTGLTTGATAVSIGSSHACAIINGGLKCWGDNWWGELGNGATQGYSSTPVSVNGFGLGSGVEEVAAGAGHSCATVAGNAYCWGYNGAGGLGDGTQIDRAEPVPVVGLGASVSAIAAGGFHTCAIVQGKVLCWGYNSKGQLGNGTNVSSVTPSAVLDENGTPVSATIVATGHSFSCASDSSTVWCWGENTFGQIGSPVLSESHVALQVLGLPLQGISAIATGDDFACAQGGNEVYCWGHNWTGALGDGTGLVMAPHDTTAMVTPAMQVALGGAHSCAGTSSGFTCWDSTFASTDFSALSAISQVELGPWHGCAVANAAAYCWGYDYAGELGLGILVPNYMVNPVGVLHLDHNVAKISAGELHSCALVAGTTRCWGDNEYSQLGDGTTVSRPTEDVVVGMDHDVSDITVGGYHSCAIQLSLLWCWGANWDGQLGDGSTDDQPSPVEVRSSPGNSIPLMGVTAVSTGYHHTCAIVDSGVMCWGGNYAGQLGDGTTVSRHAPVGVIGLGPGSGVDQVVAGDSHTCARVNGGVQCWGLNAYGALGDNTTYNRALPVVVAGLGPGSEVIDISAGEYHTCAVLSDGHVKCWGGDWEAQLGDGWMISRPEPMPALDQVFKSAFESMW